MLFSGQINYRSSRFVSHKPGSLGNHSENPINSNVAVNAASNLMPSIPSIATYVERIGA